jgi:hypothetical protein
MEDYQPDQAISWYTDTSFLHKLLNRTCRLGNIKDMFKLAFFMVDLNAQLKIVHHEYFDYYADQVHVYRGRPMSTVEFNKLQDSIGDLVVTKSFLSTTKKKDVACFYSGVGTKKPDFVPAILHMIINKQINETKSFAPIRYNSQIREDDEVLISIGTIFRIIKKTHEVIIFRLLYRTHYLFSFPLFRKIFMNSYYFEAMKRRKLNVKSKMLFASKPRRTRRFFIWIRQ